MRNYKNFTKLLALIALIFTLSLNVKAQKKEFANLRFYNAANKDLPKPAKTENRVVFLGNSITHSWPSDLLDKSYINRGIGGQTTPQMLIRFRTDVINLKPKVVVILAGTNDIAGNSGPSTPEMIMNNIESMCELAIINNIKVILCSVLPANVYPWRKGIEPADIIVDLNKRLKKYAKKKGHLYLNYYSAMVDKEKGLKSIYGKDAVHPNKEGYKIMKEKVEEAIKKAL